jgi:hypothetical protein
LAQIRDSGYAGDGIVNQGNIKQSGSGTSNHLYFYGNSLTNSGTITGASSYGSLIISDTTFTNSGTIDISNGETATIDVTTFTNLPAHSSPAGPMRRRRARRLRSIAPTRSRPTTPTSS